MKKDGDYLRTMPLLEKFGEHRINNALEKMLKSHKRYHRSVRKTKEKLEYALGLDMNSKQRLAVDRVASAYNYCGAEYGRAAYFQGLKDGIRLMSEIRRVSRSRNEQ